MESVVIIGSGCAGYTAAIYSARANLNPVVITGLLPGGLLTQTTDVENYPGFADGIMGPELMDVLRNQAERFGTKFIEYTQVTETRLTPGGPHQVTLGNGDQIEARTVIIATGASHRKIGLESEAKLDTKGVSYCAVCDGAFFRDVPLAVVGGGDSAMEEATFLTKYGSKVTVIHRRDKLRASKVMVDRAMANEKIEFAWNSTVKEILDVSQDKVTGVVLEDTQTGAERTIDCGGLFVAIGHIPDTQPFKGAVDMDENGYIILADGHSSRTSVDGVFAAGDCADHVYRQAVTAAGMGCKAAMDAERWLEAQD